MDEPTRAAFQALLVATKENTTASRIQSVQWAITDFQDLQYNQKLHTKIMVYSAFRTRWIVFGQKFDLGDYRNNELPLLVYGAFLKNRGMCVGWGGGLYGLNRCLADYLEEGHYLCFIIYA
jgi:hypothetical protein